MNDAFEKKALAAAAPKWVHRRAARFQDGKLIAFRAIADTFDAAEQLVGHSIDVSQEMQSAPLVPEGDYSLL